MKPLELLPHRKYRVRGMEMFFFCNQNDCLIWYYISYGQVLYYKNPDLKWNDIEQITGPIIKGKTLAEINRV